MPQINVGSANIDVFKFSATFDIYSRRVTFNITPTSYTGSSGNGIFSVLGASFSLEDQQGVVLSTIDFSDPTKYIVPSVNQELVIDLSSLPYPFLFQTYKISGAIKDASGTVYTTVPVYRQICQPVNLNESGYVPGIFQIIANCPDNVLSIKEVTNLDYNNLTPDGAPTKTGTLSYPTGTISSVPFTGTPFDNNVVYTGEYRIVCNTVGLYDFGDDIYVQVTYVTNNVFNVTCQNKIADLVCCMVELQTTYLKNCNNAIGKNAQQQLNDIVVPFMLGLTKEINGQDASAEADLIRKTLKCDCGATSVRQNEFTPINPAVTSIVITGVGGTVVATPTVNGNTKTYPIASNVYQVVKGNTGDLAFTISLDTSVQYMVKYKITFNYEQMASYILTAIAANPTLVAQLNSIISAAGNVDISGLNGKCVIDLSKINYVLSQNITGATKITALNTNIATYTAPANLMASSASTVQAWLNGLGLGTFTVIVAANVLTILSLNNTSSLTTLSLSAPDLTIPFQSTNATLVSVLQAVIDYLCQLTALQSQLGAGLTLWQIDYNGVPTSQGFTLNQSQAVFNQGIADSIYNIVQRIYLLTGITCAKIKSVFPDNPSGSFGSSDRVYGTLNGSCAALTDQQIANLVIAAVGKYTDVKAAFCAIDCAVPGSCPEISDINLAMVTSTSIGIYAVSFSSIPSASQVVTVKYKLSGSSTYTTATTSLIIFPNGNISGSTPFVIPGATPSQIYDIQVINNCGGVGFIKPISIPSGGVYSASFIFDSVDYNICGKSPVTLYSSQPFGTGVTLFTDAGLSTPLTGYHFVALNSDGVIYVISNTTGVVGVATGNSCSSGTPGAYSLSNSSVTICTTLPVTRYTNGSFAPGKVLYTDAALTTPQTGDVFVLDQSTNKIYNLNTSTGLIGSDTGLNCSGAAILTFGFLNVSGFQSFTANLNRAVDGNIIINRMFADGFSATDCNVSSAIASAQKNSSNTIVAGGTSVSTTPDVTTGSWLSAVRYKSYNILVNGNPVNNGDILTIGTFSVTVVINSCASF